MLPFNTGIISDHRALWLDLHIPELFKGNLHDIYTRPLQMTTKNINWMKQARKIITKHLREASVRENLNCMLENMHKVSREFNIEQLENIDAHITNAMLSGAKAYTKNFSVWWSPTLHYAYLETKYWRLRRIQSATHVLSLIHISEPTRPY